MRINSNIIKRSTIIYLSLMLTICLFLTGCLDYKTYQAPAEDISSEDEKLISDIAEIEKSIETGKDNSKSTDSKDDSDKIVDKIAKDNIEDKENKVEEEVILPEIKDKNIEDQNVQILNVKENEWIKLKVSITDPDKDPINYTFSAPLNNKGEWKTNYGDAGEYIVTITATDGKLTTEKKVKIDVERVNVPPVIEWVKDLFVKEGDIVKLDLKVTDPNKDPVTYTISDPLSSGTWTTDHTSAGEYSIKIIASDGELPAEKSFKLTVTDVNVPPEITGLSDLNIKEGETAKISPKVSDIDEGDTVTLTISEPIGNDGIWETDYTSHGEYTITVTASDGKDKVVKKVKLVVQDINMPPVISDISISLN